MEAACLSQSLPGEPFLSVLYSVMSSLSFYNYSILTSLKQHLLTNKTLLAGITSASGH